ncbi:hypothetical protein CPB83DRAFT_855033 [Crepidotus variabilis]|uniref:Uncharacterized protein n=1 Tax=Crepidotus variabilis TaxID=179855 RepID=A0A9P6EFU3_9AGAR|nr:hypothetical protein CPB83DRAFT_855033 [Crepidotus variabilis]
MFPSASQSNLSSMNSRLPNPPNATLETTIDDKGFKLELPSFGEHHLSRAFAILIILYINTGISACLYLLMSSFILNPLISAYFSLLPQTVPHQIMAQTWACPCQLSGYLSPYVHCMVVTAFVFEVCMPSQNNTSLPIADFRRKSGNGNPHRGVIKMTPLTVPLTREGSEVIVLEETL